MLIDDISNVRSVPEMNLFKGIEHWVIFAIQLVAVTMNGIKLVKEPTDYIELGAEDRVRGIYTTSASKLEVLRKEILRYATVATETFCVSIWSNLSVIGHCGFYCAFRASLNWLERGNKVSLAANKQFYKQLQTITNEQTIKTNNYKQTS